MPAELIEDARDDMVKAILEEAFKYYLGYDVVSIEE